MSRKLVSSNINAAGQFVNGLVVFLAVSLVGAGYFAALGGLSQTALVA